MEQNPRVLVLSEWVYRHLLFLYPAGHRQEYGPQMVQLFRDLSRQTHRQGQVAGVLGLWLRLIPDLGVSVGIERISELKGNDMLKFCGFSSLGSALSLSLISASIVLALGTVAKAAILATGGSVWLAMATLIGANLAAAAIMEVFAHARGTAIIPTGILDASALLSLLWVRDAHGWLRGNPMNAIVILIAAYWYASRPGRPAWPVYVVGIMLVIAEIAISLLR